MSSYSELVKNFERVRAYMREFYVYGFKSRDGYAQKSARSYDDERRRMESWLSDNMSFVRTAEGKIMFLSIDSRRSVHNPLYKAWKAKSFTDKDITLHFILFDILPSPSVALSLPEITERIDELLSNFDEPFTFDESTVRKKLKEYTEEGIIISEKQGKKVIYRRSEDGQLPEMSDMLNYFSEILPCGVIGSFLLDKQKIADSVFGFKHHYITGTLDSDVLALLFDAMQKKSFVTLKNVSRNSREAITHRLVPLRVFISAQSGRQHLLAYHPKYRVFTSFRIDYISEVEVSEECENFDVLREMLDNMQKNMWGVSCKKQEDGLERVEFTVCVRPSEEHIVTRLYREKRIGTVERIDKTHYRFTAEVYDTSELIPWIRTFICRITQLNFSNRTIENQFKRDIEDMYTLYGIGGGTE